MTYVAPRAYIDKIRCIWKPRIFDFQDRKKPLTIALPKILASLVQMKKKKLIANAFNDYLCVRSFIAESISLHTSEQRYFIVNSQQKNRKTKSHNQIWETVE